MQISIIIPTYNEKDNIQRLILLINRVTKTLTRHKFNILVVDDNSPDGTASVIKSLSKKNKNVFLLLRLTKEGLGAAYSAGMKQAFKEMNADAVLIMDADLSHDPKYIPDFVEKLEKGADFVVGSRYIKGGEIAKDWGVHRKILSSGGNVITSLFLGTTVINDWTSGYRAIRKSVYKKVMPKIEGNKRFKGYTFNMSFAYYSYLSGFSIAQVPIKFIDRTQGKSKLGLEYLFHTPLFLFRTRLESILKV